MAQLSRPAGPGAGARAVRWVICDTRLVPDTPQKKTSATIAGTTSLNVRVESGPAEDGSGNSLVIVFEDRDSTEWDILAFGGDDDRPHRLAKMKSLAINFTGATDAASVAGAFSFIAKALGELATPAPASEIS
jgi:hypothetical protein